MVRNTIKVFERLCCLSQNIYGFDIFSSKVLAKDLGISVYASRKALHSLEKGGYVKRASMGRPAIYSGYECVELECESMPPINGYALTQKGMDTVICRRELSRFDQSMRDWAESVH